MSMNPYGPERDARTPSGGYDLTSASNKNKQIERVLDMLYRRRFIIVITFVLITAAAVLYTLSQEARYEANALIMVELNRMPGGQTVGPEGSTPFVRSERSIATELFILQNSYAINNRVNQRLREMHEADPSVEYPPRGGVQFVPASRTLNNALRVTAVSRDPEEAARLANVYADEYIRQTQDASRGYLAQAHDFLQDQAAKRREELRAAEDQVEHYMETSGAVGLSQSGASIVSQLANLEAQRDDANIEIQMRRTQLSSLDRELESISPQLAERMASDTDRRMSVLQSNLAKLEEEKRTIQGAANPDQQRLQGINRQIQGLQNEMQELAGKYVGEVLSVGGIDGGASAISYAAELKRNSVQERIQLEGLESRIESMNRRVREYQGELNSIPGQSTQLARLERTRQHAEQMYQYVVQRLQETQIELESEPGYARILRKANVPSAPAGADPWKNIALGLLFGLVAGVGLALLREKVDNRIYKPDQLRARNLDVIGVIPNMGAQVKKAYGGKEHVDYHGRLLSTSLVTLLDPHSSASEAYRHLRTAVQFSRPGVVVQTVLVTSAAPSEGKSTTAANLAITMAQAKRRTLLIDADIRRPKQHKMFDRAIEPGLVQDLLGNEATSIELYKTSLEENLYVMPAGGFIAAPAGASNPTLVEDPSEMLGSKRMRDVLETLRGKFDMIIIDSPPVLSATDAVLLSTQADATIVVASSGTTKEGDLDHSLERLDDVGAQVIGTLLNRFDLSMAYGYKYSYGQYGPYSKYSYGIDDEPAKPWWKRLTSSQKVS